MRRLHAVANERGMDHAELHDWAVDHFRVGSLSDLDTPQRATFMELVERMPVISPEAGTELPASGSTPDHDGSGMAVDPATTQAPEDEADPPGTSSGPAPAPSLDDVLAVSGGEFIPPKPGTPEYKALPSGAERAKARAYWDARKGEPEQETLAAALGAPEADR